MIRTAVALLALLSLSACAKPVVAPTEADACFFATPHKDGSVAFARVTQHEPNMENCAAALEGMRLRFLGLGGNRHDIMGYYNGRYLCLGAGGVQTSDSTDGMRFPFMTHGDDGRLVAAGAPQTQ